MFRRLTRYTVLVILCAAATIANTQESTEANSPVAEGTAETPPGITLAIFPFQSRENIDSRVAAAMVTKLSAVLDATGMYTLLDRDAMASIGSEVAFTKKGDIKPKSAAEWGAANGVDYVITGMVVAAGRGHGGMGIGGVRINSKAISLAMDIRLIHCASAESLIEDTFKEEKTGLGLSVGTVEFDPESRKGSEMLDVVLKQIASAILTTFHPPVITAIDEAGELVTLNYGQGVVEVGQRWEVFVPSDPAASGKAEKTGAIRITEVQEKSSTATVVGGSAALGGVAQFDKAAKKKD